MTDLVIYGIGPFARLMKFYFAHDSDYRVVAFTADRQYIEAPAFDGLPVVAFEDMAERYPADRHAMFVAIGYRRMRNRMKLFDRAKAAGYTLANYISSAAVRYADLKLGENNVAMAGVVFEPFVEIGNHNVIWSGSLICHDVRVGDGNYIAAQCVIAGNSVLANGCFVANGTVLIDGLTLGDETHVLPGAVLYTSTKAFHRYMGNPAREMGSHAEHGIVIEH